MKVQCTPPVKAYLNRKDQVGFGEVWLTGADEVYIRVLLSIDGQDEFKAPRTEYDIYLTLHEANEASVARALGKRK